MPVLYLDTSVLVPLIVPETASARVRAWRERLSAAQRKQLVVSAWGVTEFASVMGLKVRNRELSASQAEEALALLHEEVLPAIGVIEITPTDFRLAEAMLRDFPRGLRAGDALHLAVASRTQARSTVVLDKALAKIAIGFGLGVVSP